MLKRLFGAPRSRSRSARRPFSSSRTWALESLEQRLALAGSTVMPVGGTFVQIETNQGTIALQLFNNVAPGTVANFLKYVTDGDYNGTIIHRSAKINGGTQDFVIQGGGYKTDFTHIPTDPPIANEFNLANLEGTIAMAKTSNPNSATSEWFINTANNSGPLDNPANSGGFTVFGRVVANTMSVVDAIHNLPRVYHSTVAPMNPNDPEGSRSLPVLNASGGTGASNLVVVNSVTVVAPPWQQTGTGGANDIDGDGTVTPYDALLAVNRVLRNKDSSVTQEAVPFPSGTPTPTYFFDADGDNAISRLDALAVVNQVVAASSTEAAMSTMMAASFVSAPSTDDTLPTDDSGSLNTPSETDDAAAIGLAWTDSSENVENVPQSEQSSADDDESPVSNFSSESGVDDDSAFDAAVLDYTSTPEADLDELILELAESQV